jgi:hypothetical protein
MESFREEIIEAASCRKNSTKCRKHLFQKRGECPTLSLTDKALALRDEHL